MFNTKFAVHMQLLTHLTGLEQVGKIHIDYSRVNLQGLLVVREFGIVSSRYLQVPFQVQVQFGARSGKLEVRTLCGGMLTGDAEIVYE